MNKIPLRIALLYSILAGLWILFSDAILFSYERSEVVTPHVSLQTVKGLFFVLCTAVLLYFLVRRFVVSLSESERQYKLMFDENPGPMWLYDLYTLKFLAVNKAAIRHYGYSRSEFLKMTIKDIRPEEEHDTLLEHLRGLTEISEPQYIWKHRKKNNELIYVHITGYLIRFKNKPCRLILSQDITDRLHADREIVKLNSFLTRQNERLKEYGHMYSHEIRSPLANIMGLAYLMQTDPASVSPETLALLNDACNKLDKEIRAMNDILIDIEEGSYKDNL